MLLYGINDINLLAVPEGPINDEFDKRTELVMTCEDTIGIFSIDDVKELLDRMQYPSERKRTQVVVEKMRAAEAILDSVWNALDELFRTENGESLQELLASVLPPRTLERTPSGSNRSSHLLRTILTASPLKT